MINENSIIIRISIIKEIENEKKVTREMWKDSLTRMGRKIVLWIIEIKRILEIKGSAEQNSRTNSEKGIKVVREKVDKRRKEE